MSLKPSIRNTKIVGVALSVKTWVRHAVGSDKISGVEGFENYRSIGGWYFPMHCKHISNTCPEASHHLAIHEMSDIRESLISDIETRAVELDKMIMRLQRMEEQMKSVIEQ